MNRFVIALALATLVASPAFAQSFDPHHTSAARAAAIRDCSPISQRYKQYTWGNQEILQYRACMARHSQAE